MRLSTYLILNVPILLVAAFDNTEMDKLWNLVGCDNYDLDAMLSEAKSMITNAQSSISTIASGATIVPKQSSSRIARNAHYMFGTKVPYLRTLSENDRTTLGKDTSSGINGIYQMILDSMSGNANSPPSTADSWLFCSDAAFTPTKNIADLGYDAGDRDAILKIFNTQGPTLPYVWYYPGVTQQVGGRSIARLVVRQVGNDQSTAIPICKQVDQGTLLAETFGFPATQPRLPADNPGRMMILCDSVLNADVVKPSLASYRGNVADGSYQDPYKSLPGMFIHEMMHWMVFNTYSDKFVSPGTTTRVKSYNFYNCYYLANKQDQAVALTNPDNFRLFAEATFIGNTKWEVPAPQGQQRRRAEPNFVTKRSRKFERLLLDSVTSPIMHQKDL
ncbi:MAG: hypothetical protein M1821_000474 [Bathelium mastoideum]|nr:MAG: hypothetical protein M1821_000474 [Bathelium mastoideum]